MRAVVVLGSTGSVGTQALDVIASAPARLRVAALAAGGGRLELLAKQTLDTEAEAVAVATSDAAPALREAIVAEAVRRGLREADFRMPEILAGPEAATEVAAWPADVVLNGITGSIGLAPTLAAVSAGARVALANKESLVAGGPLVRAALRDATGDDGLGVVGAPHPMITPVDSEHSAIAQCLRGGRAAELRRLVITASGGPFRGRTVAELSDVTLEQALAHPTWDMGPVITLNSATLVNKGLELIEAHELFNVPYERIDVVVHPQSIVHSMVEFVDGASIAQAHKPDLRVPIAFGLTWPDRIAIGEPDAGLSWEQASTWNFEPLDNEAFPAVSLARAAGLAGRCRPAIYNAANEECIEAFLARRLRFVDIVATIDRVLTDAPDFDEPRTVEDVLIAENWARQRARSLMGAEV